MNVGDRYSFEMFDETTGEIKIITFEVVSVQDGVIESIQVS